MLSRGLVFVGSLDAELSGALSVAMTRLPNGNNCSRLYICNHLCDKHLPHSVAVSTFGFELVFDFRITRVRIPVRHSLLAFPPRTQCRLFAPRAAPIHACPCRRIMSSCSALFHALSWPEVRPCGLQAARELTCLPYQR